MADADRGLRRGIMPKEKKTSIAEDQAQIVVFRVGAEEYGLDLNYITEVVRPLKITPLPRMPEFVEGVINLRGAIIPVVDLRKRFELSGIKDNPRKMRMIITRGAASTGPGRANGLLGLVVDEVHEVLYISKSSIEPPPEAVRGENSEFITGVGKVGDRLVILIDISRVLSQQERKALAEAGDGQY